MNRQDLHEPLWKKPRAKVLIMEDDRYFALIVTELLRNIGYEVFIAKDGWEAVGSYCAHMKAANPFDAVILDIEAKEGMGAGETLIKLLEIDPAVKAVVSSGNSEDPLIRHYEKFGFKAALPKPYSPGDASSAIARAMKSNKIRRWG